jgi:hypothetical protein
MDITARERTDVIMLIVGAMENAFLLLENASAF